VAKLTAPTHATWLLRLLVEMHALELAPVALPVLPPHAAASVRTVYAGDRLLLGCTWRYTPDAPTAVAVRFAADWCGVSATTAQKAIRALVAMGGIVRADTAKVRGRTLPLYLPHPARVMASGAAEAESPQPPPLMSVPAGDTAA